jgi:hypothetical protein
MPSEWYKSFRDVLIAYVSTTGKTSVLPSQHRYRKVKVTQDFTSAHIYQVLLGCEQETMFSLRHVSAETRKHLKKIGNVVENNACLERNC